MLDHPLQPTVTQPSFAPSQAGEHAHRWYRTGKRLLDLVLVLAIGPVFLPVVAVLMLLTSLDGHAALYSQLRVGQNGRLFRFWKLRTMIPNADGALERYLASNPEARAEWDTTQKLRHDPRLTPIGCWLRRYSLDELPQLWNVLIGDMSLVGPRPMMPSQRALYPGTDYYELRPGLTGLWQISERNSCSFAERAAYDSRYAQSVSFTTDLGILLRTVGVIFRGTGC